MGSTGHDLLHFSDAQSIAHFTTCFSSKYRKLLPLIEAKEAVPDVFSPTSVPGFLCTTWACLLYVRNKISQGLNLMINDASGHVPISIFLFLQHLVCHLCCDDKDKGHVLSLLVVYYLWDSFITSIAFRVSKLYVLNFILIHQSQSITKWRSKNVYIICVGE